MADNKALAQILLEEQGIKAFKKDIKSVDIHHLLTLEHQVGGGSLPPDHFSHRDAILITMADGTKYEVLQETVDKDGNFSEVSARMATREFRIKEEGKKNDIKTIRARSGLTRQAFCKKYEIPIRTLEKWERGEREPAEYIVALLDRAVREDFE